jgi:hypothetical protein
MITIVNCLSFTTFEYALNTDQSFSVTAKEESAVYSPWVNMTNTALSLLRNERVDDVREYDKEINLILQHNDPNLLHYKHNSQESGRKPDSIFMATSTACALHNVPPEDKWTDAEWIEFAKERATSMPKGESLNWGDAFSSTEYKRDLVGKVDSKEVAMPEAKTFATVLESEHLRKRKRRANKTEDESTISAYVYPDCLLEC